MYVKCFRYQLIMEEDEAVNVHSVVNSKKRRGPKVSQVWDPDELNYYSKCTLLYASDSSLDASLMYIFKKQRYLRFKKI